jgi:STE24 endopeptidase
MRVRAFALCVAAAVEGVAAWLLWDSSVVPSSLRLPHVDPHTYFTTSQLHAAASFGRVEDVLWWATMLAPLVVLAVYARIGARLAGESAAGPIGTGMLLGILGFALVWLVQVPVGVVQLWWERRHGLSRVGYLDSLFKGWLAVGVKVVLLCLALAIAMGLARRVRVWWPAAAVAFVALGLLFTLLSPYLVSAHPLRNPALRATATRLEAAEHVGHVPIVVEKVHDVTTEPNSEALGIGPSRRVVLWDTILDGRFSAGELKVVVAHELGHLARHHLWKGVAWFALFAFPGTFVLAVVTRRRGGMANPRSVPLALLVVVVLQLLALPLQNAISRHIEGEADWMALRTTRDPADAIKLFRGFATTSLQEPNPSTLDYLLQEDHPTIAQRIAMVQAWSGAGP